MARSRVVIPLRPGYFPASMSAIDLYSKKQVRRAGRTLRDFRSGARRDVGNEELLDAINALDWWRARHARPLARVNAGLRYYVHRAAPPEVETSVTQRLKRFSTIVDKLQREPTMQLTNMEDIGGVRAVLQTQTQVDFVARELRRQSRWNVTRVREYVSGRYPGPKSDGYRAVHVTVKKDSCYVEIQLRTPWQDVWAQSVEQDTRRLRAGLKFGSGPADLREYFRVIAEYLETREQHQDPPQELMGELSNLFAATRRYYPEGENT